MKFRTKNADRRANANEAGTAAHHPNLSGTGSEAYSHRSFNGWKSRFCQGSAENDTHPFNPAHTRADWLALAALMATSCFVFLWNLSASGYANEFYSAAAQAGSQNWEAFLWGSLDAGNAITVDKPPASIWLMALSVRLLGLSSFAILLPQALMGICCTYLSYTITRRYWGNWAGIAAGLAFTFTPVAALMFRFNNPDALLVTLMLGASGCVLRGLELGCERIECRKRTAWFATAGALIGFGFLTKQLQAMLVLPGFALAMFAFSQAPLRRRFLDAALALGAMVVAAGWWVLLGVVVPSGQRPYFGGSQTDSFLELTFSYNGLGRLTGNETGSVVPGGSGGTAQGGMWGETGLFRLFSSGFNDQITWLALFAFAGIIVGIIAALALKRNAICGGSAQRNAYSSQTPCQRHEFPLPGNTANKAESAEAALARMRLASIAVFGAWLVATWLVFSFMAGIFHQYYTVALAPAVAIMAAICLQGLWELRHRTAAKATAALLTALSSAWAFALIQQSGWQTWLAYVVVVAGTGAAAAGLICALFGHGESPSAKLARTSRKGMRLAVAVALVTLMCGPIAWTGCTIAQGHHGSIVTAGPSSAGGMGGAPGDDGASGNKGSQDDMGEGAIDDLPANDSQAAPSEDEGGSASQQPGPQASTNTSDENTDAEGTPDSGSALSSSNAEGAPDSSGPQGQPGAGGGSLLGGGGSSSAIAALLQENASEYRWAAAITGAQSAAGYQLASELPVMAIGGFNGSDPAPTLDEFKSFVEEGLVRYYISSNGMGGNQMGGSDAAQEIAEWVSANFEAQTIDGITVYDLSVSASAN